MASRRLTIVLAIVAKDLIALWPMVVASLILPVAVSLYPVDDSIMPGPKVWATLLGILATAFMTLSLFHQDSATDPRHDWLVRPVTPTNLLSAKALFLFVVVIVPHYAAAFAAELIEGRSIAEAIPAALVDMGPTILVLVPCVAVGLITSTLIQAMIAAVVPLGLYLLVWRTLIRDVGPVTIQQTGLGWIAGWSVIAAGAVLSAVTVWLLYGRKSPTLARGAMAIGAAIILINPLQYAAEPAFALQRGLSASPQAAAEVKILATACKLETTKSIAYQTRFQSDPSAMGIKASVDATGAPPGWLVALDRVIPRYVSAIGSPLAEPAPDTPDQTLWTVASPSRMTWAASGRDQARLAAKGAKLLVQADITVLKPTAEETLLVDGRRRKTASLGYCTATPHKNGHVGIDCFKPGVRLAAVRATDARGRASSLGSITYAPRYPRAGATYATHISPLDPEEAMQLSVDERTRRIHAPPPRTVVVTAYRAEAHVVRATTVDLAVLEAAPLCPQRRRGNAGEPPLSSAIIEAH